MKEPKEVLVKDIKELDTCIRIKVINCCWCNKTHEYITIGSIKINGRYASPDGTTDSTSAIEVLPHTKCQIPGRSRRWITDTAIYEQRVFKLIDLDDYFESEEVAKNKLCEEMAARKKLAKV